MNKNFLATLPRIAAAAVLALFLGVARPADAISSHCETTIEHLVDWSHLDANGDLSSRDWGVLRSLAPFVFECIGIAPTLSDVEKLSLSSGVSRWRSTVGLYFETGDVERVLCLMTEESGGNPMARNPATSASGLMQVMPSWAGMFGLQTDDLFDPNVNLWVSRQILQIQGWEAWSPYQRGACQ